jgi:hypothetical protein
MMFSMAWSEDSGGGGVTNDFQLDEEGGSGEVGLGMMFSMAGGDSGEGGVGNNVQHGRREQWRGWGEE